MRYVRLEQFVPDVGLEIGRGHRAVDHLVYFAGRPLERHPLADVGDVLLLGRQLADQRVDAEAARCTMVSYYIFETSGRVEFVMR